MAGNIIFWQIKRHQPQPRHERPVAVLPGPDNLQQQPDGLHHEDGGHQLCGRGQGLGGRPLADLDCKVKDAVSYLQSGSQVSDGHPGIVTATGQVRGPSDSCGSFHPSYKNVPILM